MTKQIDDLAFENHTLREDLKESSILIKNYQMSEMDNKKKLAETEVMESARVSEYETKMDEVKSERD